MTLPSALAEVTVRLRAAGCVFAEDEARLLVDETLPAGLEAAVARRVAGLPLEQILGWAEFDGLRVTVAPGVFVPRRRSELLVRVVVEARPTVVADLCCGSGAVGLAVLRRLPGVEVHGVDVDPAAVGCARTNLAGRAQVHHGDLFDALPPWLAGRVDVVVACPPYVPTGAIATMPPEARDHEPRVALDGGTDGLDIVRRLVGAAPRWLTATGLVVVETSERQAEVAASVLARAGLSPQVVRDDDLGATVVTGRMASGVAGDRVAGDRVAGDRLAGAGPAGAGPATPGGSAGSNEGTGDA